VKRVLVTRPVEQASSWAALLADAGYEPIVAPTVAVEPLSDLAALDAALRHTGKYRWVILASATAAALFAERLAAARLDGRALARTALVTGRAGAAVLEAAGLSVGRIVSPFSAAAVLDELTSEPLQGMRVLLPRAEGGREELAEGLRARGAMVDEVTVYRTVSTPESADLVAALRSGVAAVTFFSPSAVRGFVAAVRSGGLNAERALDGVVVACLGDTTAREARGHGLRVDVVPDDTTPAAFIRALAAVIPARREAVCLA
jgi:uroporphyrinogen-III synthase